MMGHKIPMGSGDELDAFTRWRRYLHWRPGERARIKRGYRRRERQVARRECRCALRFS
jgi:hypothetical protein